MSDIIQVPCPKCGSPLKLRDRKLLGRKGKCPKCAHRFLLVEPASAKRKHTTEPTSNRATSAHHDETTRPDWMPSSSDSTTQLADPPQQSASPATEQHASAEKKADIFVPISNDPPPVVSDAPPNEFTDFSSLGTTSTLPAGASRLQALKQKQKKQRNIIVGVGSLICLAVAVVAYFVSQQQQAYNAAKKQQEVQQKIDLQAKKESLKEQVNIANSSNPTAGKPIELRYLPAGCRGLVHLHPDFFWEEGSLGQEFRFCFGEEFNNWFSAELKKLCLFEMQDIDRVLIGIILGPRGTPPEFVAVVHMKADYQRRDYIRAFGGVLHEKYSQYKVYKKDDRAFLLNDKEKIFVNCPVDMIGESIQAMKYPNPTSTGIEELIKQSDRDRHLTLMIEPNDALIATKSMIPELAQPAWKHLFEWMGPDVETALFSLHLDDGFHSKFLLRNQFKRKAELLHGDFDEKLNSLPQTMLALVKKMQPQKSGPRKIIGRYPAMLKAFSLATSGSTGERYVQFTTTLPERAAPNLAIGSLLAWDESTRTDFTLKPSTKPSTPTTSGLPKTVIGRLRQKIEIDFRRAPLYEAFEYIAEETKTEIIIDGDALKLSGFTKNMPQIYNMGNVPATEAIAHLISQRDYELMRIVVDEKGNKVIVTTKDAVEAQKLTPYDFAAEVKKKK